MVHNFLKLLIKINIVLLSLVLLCVSNIYLLLIIIMKIWGEGSSDALGLIFAFYVLSPAMFIMPKLLISLAIFLIFDFLICELMLKIKFVDIINSLWLYIKNILLTIKNNKLLLILIIVQILICAIFLVWCI